MSVDDDVADAIRIRDHMEQPLQVAVDAVLEAGWTIERIRITHDITRGTCMTLQVRTELTGWWTVFEVALTFDLAHPDGARAFVVERWCTEIPEAPRENLDEVDRAALARMFPRWDELPASRRGAAKKRGTIRCREVDR